MKVTLVDYGAGNVRSVINALAEVGQDAELTGDAARVAAAECLILPGVGHFSQLFAALQEKQLEGAIKEAVGKGKPLLGICLGMQALYEGSEEAYGVNGLGLLAGNVVRLPDSQKVPQIGWNRTAGGNWLYFANSYGAPISANTLDSYEYGGQFAASVRKDNVWGFQFHPEKSGLKGLELLRGFLEAAHACA
jgi:glutamine amidotransferase